MTERLYYTDAYCVRFEARLIATEQMADRLAVVLDRSAFYPTGGGQPHDTGTLAGWPVLEVIEREADGAVLHLLPAEATLRSDQVTGEIDWPRRFDHMQQHTGQHILSQAFVQVANADTVGFHMSSDYSTIDVNSNALSEADIARAEALANQIVFEDRPVFARLVTAAEAATLPLRKPPAVQGAIRIVQVEGFDWSACGGTHVARSGAVGLIKIVRQERRGAETRLTFLCGRRALEHYHTLLTLTGELARSLSVGVDELPRTLERMQAEARAAHKERELLRNSLLDYEAEALANRSQAVGRLRVVSHIFDGRSVDEARQLASRIAARPDHVALLGVRDAKAQLIFACAPGLSCDMRALLGQVCQAVGGRGGGGPTLAQGGGADPARLDEALGLASELLRQQVAGG
jgi:alanyl-tRNA synthetase